MVYFHIDRMQRYIQSLGFADVNRRPIPVNIAGLPLASGRYEWTVEIDQERDLYWAEAVLREQGESHQRLRRAS